MANHPSGGRWLSQVIVAMDDLIYDQANVAHDHMAESHAEPVGLPQNRAASAF